MRRALSEFGLEGRPASSGPGHLSISVTLDRCPTCSPSWTSPSRPPSGVLRGRPPASLIDGGPCIVLHSLAGRRAPPDRGSARRKWSDFETVRGVVGSPRVEPQKVSLLFGDVPVGFDPDDREDRAALLAERLGIPDDASSGALVRLMLYETVATQIAEEDPPEVWATARRLLGRGLEPDQVLANLVMTLAPSIHASMADEVLFDPVAYAAALERLPLPTPAEIEAAMLEVTREHQPIPIDDLERLTRERLGFAHEAEPFQSLLDQVSDQIMDPDGPLVILAGDQVVEPASLCAGIVLTHKFNGAERELGVLTVSVDLVGFRPRGGTDPRAARRATGGLFGRGGAPCVARPQRLARPLRCRRPVVGADGGWLGRHRGDRTASP